MTQHREVHSRKFYIGGYSPELHLAELDVSSGAMRVLTSVRTPANASFLNSVAGTGLLYTTVETGTTPAESGNLAAFHLDDAGVLSIPMIRTRSRGMGGGRCVHT